MVDVFFLEVPKGSPVKCLSRGSRQGENWKKALFSPHCEDETTTYSNRAFGKSCITENN